MSKFNSFKNNEKKNSYRNDKNQEQQNPVKKVKYVKKNIPIASSNFYNDSIDSLYNLLSEITFDKIAIPVNINKSDMTGDFRQKGTIILGNAVKFNNDNTITVSMTEDNAKVITDKSVIAIRCHKDRGTGEITYITSMSVNNRYPSINDKYKDIEEAFTNSEKEDNNETTED